MKQEWDESGPLQLSQDLTLDDLKDQTAILPLSATLLRMCERLGGIKATQAGYLNTRFVMSMAASMLFEDEDNRGTFMEAHKGRLKEMDFPPLFQSTDSVPNVWLS